MKMTAVKLMTRAVKKTVHGQAIRLMKDKGVAIAGAEERMALQLFPRVGFFLVGN